MYTFWQFVNFVFGPFLLIDPEIQNLFCSKNGKVQKRGKINMIGRLQLSTEKSKEEENEGIVQLRILRTQVFSSFIIFIVNVTVIM